MATTTTTVQGKYLQKIAAEQYLLLHPETDADIVMFASEHLTSDNVADALEELYSSIQAAASESGVTGVKGSAETEYRTGNVNITAENIGLGNVDNTSDEDKPISTATQTALDKKQDVLSFDTAPTENSGNPVTSGGVYTAIATAKSEVEAEIPDVSEYITKAVSDLTYYYTKTEIDTTVSTLENAISAIPKFAIEVVDSLPTADISATTVYLVKSGTETGNLYTEYIYVNEKWEELGAQALDLSGYVTTAALNTAIADFLTETDVNSLITTALASYYTKTEVDNLLAAKQDTLTIDTALSTTSTNPVQNSAIATGINAAQSAADEAQSTADSAASAASAAQTTANTAVTNAATAQTTADNAATAASAAQSTANSATTAAATAQSGVDSINEALEDTTVDGTYSAVSVNAAGIVVAGAQVIEVGAESQTEPSDTLAIGGIFFQRI